MIFWKIEYQQPPAVIRFCKRCKTKTAYVSSGQFRINANGKVLDIWLIYCCRECGQIWKLEVKSRVSLNSIPKALLKQYMENDIRLSFCCAMDVDLLAQAGVEIGKTQFEVVGEALDFSKEHKITITSQFPAPVRVPSVLRKKLGWSSKEFQQAVREGRLIAQDGRNLRTCKVDKELVVLYRP